MNVSSKYAGYSSIDNENSGSASGSGSGDRERDPQIKIEPYATVRGRLQFVYGSENKVGQSIGIRFEDGKLVDGALYKRTDDPMKYKLFNWSQLPVILDEDEELTADHAPEVHSESFQQTGTLTYELVAARVAEDEDEGIEADPADPIEIGDFMVWEGGRNKPSASGKALAQLLTVLGRDAVIRDEDGEVSDDIKDWLNLRDDEGNFHFSARDDLLGRELDLFKVEVPGRNFSFHRPVIVDVKTGEQVIVDSPLDAPASSHQDDEPDEPEEDVAEPEVADPADVEEYPEAVVDFITFCRDFDMTDEQVLDSLNEMVEDENNRLSSEMVEEVGGPNAILTSVREA